MSALRTVPLCTAVLALAGCALLKAPEPEAPEPPAEEPPAVVETIRESVPELDQALKYFQRVRRLGGAELVREHDGARLSFARTRSDLDRVRLAMVLSLHGTGVSDDARALELLEPLVRSQNSALHGLAFLLQSFVQEQRRLGHGIQGMQQKLDALKSMERSLIEREQGGQRRR
ncbi:MAG: hypothetical protein HY526_04885 [Betaproteobacteria bacterium]|nr:hypothetical protein [Betaproteobacteria bacterium]